MPQPQTNIVHLMEAYIDKYSLRQLLIEISDICTEKADHIRQSYNDEVLASEWDEASEAIHELAFEEIDL